MRLLCQDFILSVSLLCPAIAVGEQSTPDKEHVVDPIQQMNRLLEVLGPFLENLDPSKGVLKSNGSGMAVVVALGKIEAALCRALDKYGECLRSSDQTQLNGNKVVNMYVEIADELTSYKVTKSLISCIGYFEPPMVYGLDCHFALKDLSLDCYPVALALLRRNHGQVLLAIRDFIEEGAVSILNASGKTTLALLWLRVRDKGEDPINSLYAAKNAIKRDDPEYDKKNKRMDEFIAIVAKTKDIYHLEADLDTFAPDYERARWSAETIEYVILLFVQEGRLANMSEKGKASLALLWRRLHDQEGGAVKAWEKEQGKLKKDDPDYEQKSNRMEEFHRIVVKEEDKAKSGP